LWLLDEPATALDRAAAKNLDDAIHDHRQAGGMVVVSTHAEAGLPGAGEIDLGKFQDGQFQAAS
jgi:heme exporter protein A